MQAEVLLNILYLYPLQLEASIHETIWGGDRLRQDGWKRYAREKVAVGEAWETEISTVIQNGPYRGKTLGEVVAEQGSSLLGQQAITVFGQRFPLLAKFIDANSQLSVQVHPSDDYASQHEGGKLGKTEFWYVLKADPGATIVHGFKRPTSRAEVEVAIHDVTLDQLLHSETVQAGDVIFVPAGTVHAIGAGVQLYELQEYSDVTYRMYDYGRLSASGKPRELHIEQALDVSHYTVSPQIKVQPTVIANTDEYEDRRLVTCQYFASHEIRLKRRGNIPGIFKGQTSDSCIILSSLGAEARVYYGADLDRSETLTRGQTIVLPAALGAYHIEGHGKLLYSYVP